MESAELITCRMLEKKILAPHGGTGTVKLRNTHATKWEKAGIGSSRDFSASHQNLRSVTIPGRLLPEKGIIASKFQRNDWEKEAGGLGLWWRGKA